MDYQIVTRDRWRRVTTDGAVRQNGRLS